MLDHKRKKQKFAALLGTVFVGAWIFSASNSLANPEGGMVVGGNADLSYNGNKLDIYQHTDRAVIDWRSFNIGATEHTQFHQPTSASIAVNRINDINPSAIDGRLSANGHVVLINPNGVMFGTGSQIDVGSLTATTADISNEDAMAGRLHFNRAGASDARIINAGRITAKEAGLVTLVAPHVENRGTIEAKLGQVTMASGDMVSLDMAGDGLIKVAVSRDSLQGQVINGGVINADGGRVVMSASAARDLVDNLIVNTGHVSARTVNGKTGSVSIKAEGANKTAKIGSSKAINAGKIDVSGKTASDKGGKVEISADHVEVTSTGAINADGAQGGGAVHLGGEYKGEGTLETALTNKIESGAVITANADEHGDGGEVIVWADGDTYYDGFIEAKGGSISGNGGFVETSGKVNLRVTGSVNVSANNLYGASGHWLLDPQNVRITNAAGASIPIGGGQYDPSGAASPFVILDSSISAALSAGNNVTITTTNPGLTHAGDITLDNATILKSGGGDVTFTLKADGGIQTNGTVSITSTQGALHTVLWTDTDNNGITDPWAAVNLYNTTINTNGGDFFIGGGLDTGGTITSPFGETLYTGIAGDGRPDTYAGYNNVGVSSSYGIFFDNSHISTGNGNITILGRGETGAGSAIGLEMHDTTITSTNGNILLVGVGGVSSANIASGIEFYNSTVSSTGSGSITMGGTGGTNPANRESHGIGIHAGNTVSAVDGNINMYARAAEGGNWNVGLSIDGNVTSTGQSAITLKGINDWADGDGIYFGPNAVVGGENSTGNHTFISNAVVINSTSLLQTTGNITIKPLSNNKNMYIGSGGGMGNFTLTSAALQRFTASNLIIGDSINGTGNMFVDSWDFTGKNYNVELYGNNITVNGTLHGINGDTAVSTLLSAKNNIDINSSMAAAGALTLDAQNNITISDADIISVGLNANRNITYDGTAGLARTINAGTGTLSLAGITGGDRAVTLIADNLSLTGAVTTDAGRTLSIKPYSNNRAINIGGGVGGLDIDATQLLHLQSGGEIHIGTQTNGTGAVTTTNAAFSNGVFLYGGQLYLNGLSSAGRIFAQSQGVGNDITLGGIVSSNAAGNAITLVSADDFINNAGNSALFTSNAGGRWLVYSERMDQNTRGGLLPDASEFGVTYPTGPAGTGNRFIYSSNHRETLTLQLGDGTVQQGSAFDPTSVGYIVQSGLLNGDTIGNIGLSGTLDYATTYNENTTIASPVPYAGMITAGTGTFSSVLGYDIAINPSSLLVTAPPPPAAPDIPQGALLPPPYMAAATDGNRGDFSAENSDNLNFGIIHSSYAQEGDNYSAPITVHSTLADLYDLYEEQ